MPETFPVNRLFQELIAVTSGGLGVDEAQKRFSDIISSTFMIDKVSINGTYGEDTQQNELFGYISNTKKVYVDNQLSEYSSFPELIKYKNRGFKSCALVPIVLGGRVVAIVEMLSFLENKFGDELINSASLGAYFSSIALVYKYENDKSFKLASYFNAAFNGGNPQLLISSENRIIKANDRARDLIAQKSVAEGSVEEFLGMNFARLASLKKPDENVMLSKKGSMRLYKITASKVNDRLLHIELDDMTELDMLGTIVDSMDAESYAGAIYLDKELIVTGATDSIKRVIGYDKSLITGKSIIELTIERQRGELTEMLGKRDEGSTRLHGSISLASESGIPANLRFVLSRWSNGSVMVFADAGAENYVEGIKAAFSDFINSTSDIVITMDDLGYIKDCNMPAETVLGYPRSMLIGKDLRSMYSDQQAFEKNITFVRNGGKIDNSYASIIDKDGNKIEATHSIRLFRNGNFVDYIIVVKELETKRRLGDLDDELERARNTINKLKSTGDLKSQFIYNISHELKTPLTNIIGFSKLLYSGEFGQLNSDQLNYIKTIIDEADRFMMIIQQVLDASKLESEKMKLDLKEVDMRGLGDNPTIQAMKQDAANKGIKFSWTVAFDVPQTIIADPNRLIQVFVNLVGNSIKFTDKGEIAVKIAKKNKSLIECSVSDTGIGISEEDRHKLFRKFYEAPTKKGLVKQAASGTGLGLSITKAIVELHGGKIACESEPMRGSRFYFTLRIKGSPKRKEQ